jgi:putative transcriptional regulator
MGKNAYRAHIDNVLEELYDNDWRVFRAKLVSQEQEQQEIKKETAPPSSSSSPPLHENDKLLQKQKQLSDFFAGAIGSIFKSHRNKKDADIFDGDLAGAAASMEELVPEGMIDDPFMSLSELPILIPKSQPVDKHRWAHELGHVEPGAVLIANEKLAGTFRQAVVLVVGHSEKQGTLGVVINRYVAHACGFY